MSDPITSAATDAVGRALNEACEAHNILPPLDITAHLWAVNTLQGALAHGRLPSTDELSKMLDGVPPLLISDRNK
jgi:hypothetical protein